MRPENANINTTVPTGWEPTPWSPVFLADSSAGPNAVRYARKPQDGAEQWHFDAERKRQEENNATMVRADGSENPFKLWRELGDLMTRIAPSSATTRSCRETDAQLCRLLERFRHINLSDRSQVGQHIGGFRAPALQHAATGAGHRPGCGHARRIARAHYKPDFPERDDKNWLKTTKATFAPDADEPKFDFEPVDVSLIPPRPRRYDA